MSGRILASMTVDRGTNPSGNGNDPEGHNPPGSGPDTWDVSTITDDLINNSNFGENLLTSRLSTIIGLLTNSPAFIEALLGNSRFRDGVLSIVNEALGAYLLSGDWTETSRATSNVDVNGVSIARITAISFQNSGATVQFTLHLNNPSS